MKVADILRVKGRQVYAIAPTQTVLEAVARLMEHRIGALLVQDADGTVHGIVSERDVLRECLHRSRELGTIPVTEAMTRQLVVCREGDDVGHAMGLVTEHRVRHLPVMEGERVAGMISIGDLVKATLDEAVDENRLLREYMHGT